MAGGMYLGSAVAGKVVGRPAPDAASPQAGQTADLSARETDVLRLVACGHGNKEIPARLNISVETFGTYKARTMEKLGYRTRVEVVRYAAEKG